MHPPRPLLPATATVSLGAPGTHGIIPILEAASNAGLKGIEIFYNHLAHHAATLSRSSVDDVDRGALLRAAKDVRQHCDQLGPTVITLQPLAQYDGLLDQAQHHKMVRKFELWVELAHTLGCSVVQIPTNMVNSGTTGNTDKIVADIVELADIAIKADPVINLAYEAMSWGAPNNLCWEVVKRADRSNVGLCLDTFHIAARVWGDPCSADGKTPNADADLASSIARLVRDVDVEKIFYLQLSDAERLASPLVEGHEFYNEEKPRHMSWSRNARLFPCEEDRGGYLPVMDVTRAVINELGYRGWTSMEIFSRYLFDPGEEVPGGYAGRAVVSYGKVREILEWEELR